MATQKKSRRGNNEGTVYKRPDGTWCGQVTVGINPATGKSRRPTFYGRTRAEVVAKMTDAKHKVQTGTYIEPTSFTLGQWLDKWLTEYKKGQLKPSTYQSYAGLVARHIKPALGSVPLAKLQAHNLQAFYNEKLASGRISVGKHEGTEKQDSGLSTRVVRYFHAVIREALQQAVKEGLLPRNVADATSPPAMKHKPMRPLTEDELLTFLGAAKEDRFFAAYLLAVTTGLRRGELLGLCWDSVDLKGAAIVVQRQLLVLEDEANKYGFVLDDTTKSESGRRSISLTDDAVRELKAHRKRQLQEKIILGPAYQDKGLVFCKEDGSPVDPRNFTKRFQRILRAAGLPQVRLHDLRHTHASLLLARGVHPKVVQERLGHASITMTLDLYSHLAPGLQEAAAATLNGLVERSEEKREKEPQ